MNGRREPGPQALADARAGRQCKCRWLGVGAINDKR